MLIVVQELNNNDYAWCLRYNICSAWFLDIRIYQLVYFLYVLHFVPGKIMRGYNMVEHSVTGATYCTSVNYCN